MKRIVQSLDGTSTIYFSEIDEHYHSMNGAKQESKHVFIDSALMECIDELNHLDELNIFEVGFGTGLNAFLTALAVGTRVGLKINYYSVEAFPLPLNIVKELNYSTSDEEKKIYEKLHSCKWNEQINITSNFTLFKIHADFTKIETEVFKDLFHIVYFDAFSPDKQPEMWERVIFNKIYYWCKNDAILTTYCAKGYVRRCLQDVGFRVERLQGPPGKREMLRAQKISLEKYEDR